MLSSEVWRAGYTCEPIPLPPVELIHTPTNAGDRIMQASVDGQIVAQSNDLVECQGYQYFPREAVRMDLLEKTAKTDDDRACPHGVQFYDVVVAGERHPRAAWSYEAPQPKMRQVADRFGFWQAVEVK
jgi:uncharacterized protein (DUF427 family)